MWIRDSRLHGDLEHVRRNRLGERLAHLDAARARLVAVDHRREGVHLLGTSAKSIDNAEDRDKFSAMLDRIGVDQPQWSALTSMDDINAFIDRVGFPVLVRPSYVLSGAAMNVCSNEDELKRFLQLAANVSEDHPVVVSKFIEHAKEIEMDAVAKNGEVTHTLSLSTSSLPVYTQVTLQSSSRRRSSMLRPYAVVSV